MKYLEPATSHPHQLEQRTKKIWISRYFPMKMFSSFYIFPVSIVITSRSYNNLLQNPGLLAKQLNPSPHEQSNYYRQLETARHGRRVRQ